MPRTLPDRLIAFSLRHARIVAGATFALTLVFGWFALKVKVNPDFISLLPRDAEVNALLEEYGAEAVQPDVLVFAVTAARGDVLDPDALVAYGAAVDAISALPGVESTISPFNLVAFGRENGRLAIRPMSPGGVAPDAESAAGFRARLSSARYAQDLVVSSSGRMLISYFQTRSMGSFKGFMAEVDGITAAVRAAGLTPYVTGTIPLNVRTEYHLTRDAARLLLLAALIIMLSYVASYRSLRAVVFPLGSVLLGTVWTVGFMGMAGYSLSLITIVAPPLILIFGNEYNIFTTSAYLRVARTEAAAPGWIERASRGVAKPIAMAVLTTIIGFLSLLTTSIRQTREFAVIASFGSLACAFLALFFLPAMYSLLHAPPARARRRTGALERAMRGVAGFASRRPAVVLGVLGAAVVLFACTIPLLTFNTDPASYFPQGDPVLQDMSAIYDEAGGYEQIAVSFDAPGRQAGYFLDAGALARVQEVERKLASIPDVSYALSLPDLLQEINRAAAGDDAIPSNRAAILTLSRLLTAAGSSSPGGELLAGLVDGNFSRVTVVFRVLDSSTGRYLDEARLRALVEDMRKVVADNPIGAAGVVWSEMLRNLSFADSLRRTLFTSMAISLLSILALTMLVFRSLRLGLYAVVPLAAGLVLNYSMMALTGIPLDLTTIMVSNIAIGVGVDSAIYLVIQYRRELGRTPRDPARALGDTLAVMGQPVLLSSLSIAAGMLVFATAAFRPVVYFGMLVLFTLVATAGGTLLTLPTILALDTRVRDARRARTPGRSGMARRGRFPASIQDWFFVAISLGHDQTIRLVAEMDGRVDHPRLVRALGLLYRVEPIARSRLVEGLFRAAWEPRDDLDPSEACRLIATPDPVRDVHDYMAAPIDPRREPVAQVRVFRSARDTICFKMSHVAMDGSGLRQFVQKLTALYRGIGAGGDEPALPPVAVERRQSVALRPFPVLQRLRAFVTQPFHEKRWRFPYLAGTPSRITFSERTARITVPQLKEAARARGASVTEALIAGFARAIFRETETPSRVPLAFTVTVDLRRYVPDPSVLGACNLSSLAWIDIPHEPGSDLATILALVHDRFQAAMADAPGVGLAMVMEIVSVLGYRLFVAGNRLRIRMAQREGREFPSLSNVGAVDNRVFDFGGTRMSRARIYGSVMYPPTFYVIAGSFEESLYYSIAYPASLVPEALAEAILDRAAAELDSLRPAPA